MKVLQKIIIFLIVIASVVLVALTLMRGIANAQKSTYERRVETTQKARMRSFLRREEVLTEKEKAQLETDRLAAEQPVECPMWVTTAGGDMLLESLTRGSIIEVTMRLPEKVAPDSFLNLEFTYDLEALAGREVTLQMNCSSNMSSKKFAGTVTLPTKTAVRLGPALRLERVHTLATKGYEIDGDLITVSLSTSFVDYPRKLTSDEEYDLAWMSSEFESLRVKHDIYPRNVDHMQIQGWCEICEHDREHCECGYFDRLENPEPDSDVATDETPVDDPDASEHWVDGVDGVEDATATN